MNSKPKPKKKNKKRSQKKSHNSRSAPKPVVAQNKPSTPASKEVTSAPLVSMTEAVPSTPPAPASASEATGAQNTPLPPATEEALSGPPSTQVAVEPPTVQAATPEQSVPICGWVQYWFANTVTACLILGGSLFAVMIALKLSSPAHSVNIEFFLQAVLSEQLAFTTGAYLLFPSVLTYSLVVLVWGGEIEPSRLKKPSQINAYLKIVQPLLQLCSSIFALAATVSAIVLFHRPQDAQLIWAMLLFLGFSALLLVPSFSLSSADPNDKRTSPLILAWLLRIAGVALAAASLFFAACFVLNVKPANDAREEHRKAALAAQAKKEKVPASQEKSPFNPCYCYRLIF